MTHMFCFGLGFSARVHARRLLGRGWRVTGTSRSVDGAARLRAEGFEAEVFDGAAPAVGVRAALATATHVLVSVPPGTGSEVDPVLARYGGDLAASQTLTWIGYLSTIGVYGDHDGDWIDETVPPKPVSERSIRRLAAEMAWQRHGADTGQIVQVFRLAGIYGPGRSTIEQVRAGSARRLIKPGQVFNRIHVEDIANALDAAIARGGPAGAFNVTDDEPAPPQDVVTYACQLLGVEPPPEQPFDTAVLSEMARSFYGENKRVRNRRIRHELGVTLAYPTYREGLAALAAGRAL